MALASGVPAQAAGDVVINHGHTETVIGTGGGMQTSPWAMVSNLMLDDPEQRQSEKDLG